MPPPIPAGFMPVAIDLNGRRVRLLDLRGVDCREYWFPQTVRRWREEHPEAAQVELDLEAFAAAARLDPGRPPAGFIFHVGRCGSTLLANMLAVPDDHLVIKESATVSILLQRLLEPADDAQRQEAEALIALALPSMARSEPGTERRLFFKLSTWDIQLADSLHRLFPTTPALFLYRDAPSVVASRLASPHDRSLAERPGAIQERLFPSLRAAPRELSAVGFRAHMWRSAVEAALTVPPHRLLMLDYADLVADPAPILACLLAHFGLRNGHEIVAAMCAVQRIYSKDPDGRAEFDPAGAHYRPRLDSAQEAEVAAVIGDLPRRLADRRLRCDR